MSTCIVRIESEGPRWQARASTVGASHPSRFFADRKYGGKRKAKAHPWHWPSCPSSSGAAGGCGR